MIIAAEIGVIDTDMVVLSCRLLDRRLFIREIGAIDIADRAVAELDLLPSAVGCRAEDRDAIALIDDRKNAAMPEIFVPDIEMGDRDVRKIIRKSAGSDTCGDDDGCHECDRS